MAPQNGRDDATPNSLEDSRNKPQDPDKSIKDAKCGRIKEACRANDIEALVEHASTRFGLVDDAIRREAWSVLLGCTGESQSTKIGSVQKHGDENQVKLDVDRSFVYYPDKDLEEETDRRRSQLSDLIVTTLRQFPFLCYFQGYHDIVQVFLLVFGLESARESVARLSLLRIRDFMLPSIQGAVKHLEILRGIMDQADPKLARHLSATQPFYALAATITLYAHEIQEYGDIGRLFDFFLAHEAAMPQYFFATTILARRSDLLEYEPEEIDILHSILSRLPRPLDIEKLITETLELYHKYPPESLPRRAWSGITPYSVLKTTHDSRKLQTQTLDQGRVWFDKHAKQLERERLVENMQKLIWQYRRPGGFALAVAVAVVSYWLRSESIVGFAYALIGRVRSMTRLF